MSHKEPIDICVHNIDRWGKGCEMCDALNKLANKNVTLQKLSPEDFKLTEEEMRKKYHIAQDDIDSQGEVKKLKVTVFPKYIPEGDVN